MACGVLFLDLRKAFDTEDQSILLTKLRKYGLKQSAVSLIESYLERHLQVTKVGQNVSDPLSVTCGIPQGSILGPLLFSIYINELPKYIPPSCKINLYADDTAITVTASNRNDTEYLLNNMLSIVYAWFVMNKLSLNLKKTFYCIFGTSARCKSLQNIIINHAGVPLEYKYVAKYLGMKLDPELKFNAHADYIRSKTISKIELLGRIRNNINQSTATMLYKTLILPIFDYGDIIYDCLCQKDAVTLQRLQNMSLKTILKANKRAEDPFTR